MNEQSIYGSSVNEIDRIKNDFESKRPFVYEYQLECEIDKRYRHESFKKPGTLGYGVYSFEINGNYPFKYVKKLAKKFSKKNGDRYHYYCLSILSQIPDEQLLDLTRDDVKLQISEYRDKAMQDIVSYERNINPDSHMTPQNEFDGVLLELYINDLKEHGSNILAVRNYTYTPPSPFGQRSYPLSYITNGIELSFRFGSERLIRKLAKIEIKEVNDEKI
ncbi:hypothetical protein [Oenococcus oeni]|uniref:hypothetical protein n=1 Tax=Oenococcus oeni TaxID=1247 RepID=UPI0010B3DED2|nr:hypothetical protein [Oenococcus oeni]SYW14255.1 hypothetical protein OENI_440004 [Oenococcus oeni]